MVVMNPRPLTRPRNNTRPAFAAGVRRAASRPSRLPRKRGEATSGSPRPACGERACPAPSGVKVRGRRKPDARSMGLARPSWSLLLGIAVLAVRIPSAASADEVTVQPVLSVDHLSPGQSFQLAVVVAVHQPWHINANPASEGLIPTTLKLAAPTGITIGQVHYPAAVQVRVGWAEQPVALYTAQAIVRVDGSVGTKAALGPVVLTGTLRYQACNDSVCVAPVDLPVSWQTEITAAPGRPQHPEVFGSGSELSGAVARGDARPPTAAERSMEQLIRERGWLVTAIVVFLSGLALNLTPCVYPMIAITISYFGGRERRTRGQAFAGATAYCLGIVVSYTALGVGAAVTGGLFGALLQSRAVLLGIAGLLVVLALSLFGLFEIRPPQFLVQRAAGLSARGGQFGVFLLGATLGIIAAPCLAPFVVALLAYVGATRQWWWFGVFSAGLALPYLVLGTFSGLLASLPKSGTWMVNVKRVFGVLLLGVAVWFVWPLVRSTRPAPSLIAWQPYAPELIAHPAQPVLIDFSAEWCLPCREMDARTFTDPRVIELSKRFSMVRADLTRTGSPAVNALIAQFHIAGVPTFVFIGTDGQERGQLRQVGFVSADAFRSVMAEALTAPPSAVSPADDVPPALRNLF